ncbi:MAG: DNA-directed RNA polymerase subunit alpha [Thermotogaceae bacterium]|nr:DNA-directed RNA polymerase subunit alpha [Thermotogota bacterium]NLZ13350.1 DNA-directed RNA polymerase subunit alpha [Thermotogaceae bacterium]MDD8052786.1 DNA-directed RNA polymerase subunit alpha [Thermotogota bacterium]HNR63965.1 DNA-directed RNA polymerase subunit alpha [Thermotogota bacterium]HOZ12431.1 DNA-directed RNA polymerase subunit alpha [Thermotogota bacterium]
MIKYVMPQKLVVEEQREDGDYYYGRFILAPLEKGYATTLGNSLRRVLLSSIMALGITKIKFPDKFHEYESIEGVSEDVLEIIMNIKRIQLRKEVKMDEEIELSIKKNGPCLVTAKDVVCPAGITITNPNLHIATLNENAYFEVYMYAQVGKGYVPISEQEKPDDIQMIPIDGVFSPVVRVNFRQENVRVLKKTDYDKLVLEIWTKRNIKPTEALRVASDIMIEHFKIIGSDLDQVEGIDSALVGTPDSSATVEEIEEELEDKVESIAEEAEEEDNETEEVILPPVEKVEPVEEKIEGDVHSLSIEKLQLSVRSNNCLKRDRINTIGDLLARSPSELLKIRNFGQKSLDEVQEKLKTLFNITYEETEEKK